MTISKLRKKNKILSLLVCVLHKTRNKTFSRRSRAKRGKKCTKKCDARAKLLFCLLNLLFFLRSRCCPRRWIYGRKAAQLQFLKDLNWPTPFNTTESDYPERILKDSFSSIKKRDLTCVLLTDVIRLRARGKHEAKIYLVKIVDQSQRAVLSK